MDTESKRRAEIALPNPQEPSSVPEIELLEVSPRGEALPERPALPPPKQTWLTFLKKELEFLGVTQVLIALICLCFGTIVCSVIDISQFDKELFLSFKVGYPFWGALLFAIAGFLSIISERKNAMYLVRARLGANTVSSIAGGTGIVILILNLSNSSTYTSFYCKKSNNNDECFVATFIVEILVMILFLTVLGFCSAVSLTIYGIGEEIKRKKVSDDRLYEELNIYSPIYSELEDKGETSPTDL